MLCEVCGEKSATVHLTQMLNNEVKKLHLCEGCAAESGLDVDGAISITDVLLGLGGGAGPNTTGSEKTCSHCNMRLEDFRKTSRLGCRHCYESFTEELTPLLESMHRGHRHAGKKPAGMPPEMPALSLEELRRALTTAVTAENFEEAAQLRDRIRALEEEGEK